MARKRERIFAGFGAALFLLTASALSIAVIVDAVQSRNSSSTNDGATSTPASSTASTATSSTKKLQGTKLENFTPVAHIDKLQAIDTVPGTGATVEPGATVTVDYTGAVAATGVIFQSSLDTGQPVSFALSQVIAGWTDGLPGMKVGGTRRLLIPAAQAYGANPPAGSGIPANADLVFDITLHKIGS
jgi:FKBP-type peptidyl-prolyl cis-trans isomerase